MAVVTDFLFVIVQLTGKLVGRIVDAGVKVFMHAFGDKWVMPIHVADDFQLMLDLALAIRDHIDFADAIVVATEFLTLFVSVLADGLGDVQVTTRDDDLHVWASFLKGWGIRPVCHLRVTLAARAMKLLPAEIVRVAARLGDGSPGWAE